MNPIDIPLPTSADSAVYVVIFEATGPKKKGRTKFKVASNHLMLRRKTKLIAIKKAITLILEYSLFITQYRGSNSSAVK